MLRQEDVIKEIIHCAGERDIIKAKVILREVPHLEKKTVQRVFYEIIASDPAFCIPLMTYMLTQLPNVAGLFPELHEALLDRISKLDDIQKCFNKLQTVDEIAYFIETLSERDDEKVIDFLKNLLRTYTEKDLLVSTLKTMGEIKDKSFAAVVSDFLYADDLEVICEAVNTLGCCITPLAVNALYARAGANKDVDKAIIKALASGEIPEALDAMAKFLGSRQASLRNYARLALTRLREKAVPSLLKLLDEATESDLIILCLNTLGETGSSEAVKPVRRFIQTMPENPNVRFAAYEALGLLPVRKGAYTLTGGLIDPDEMVRTAAAKAVDHLFDDFFEVGLNNLLTHEENPYLIVDALLTAECDKTYRSLIKSTDFKEHSKKYFKENKSDELIRHYLEITDDESFKKYLKTLIGKTFVETAHDICVVDDSKLLLRIYRKMLAPTGLSFELFEHAEAALEYVKNHKPSLVLTDLNMPQMDGHQFSREIRKIYASEELPIVMVTTQEEGELKDSFGESGIQEYLIKPFTETMLSKVIKGYIKKT